MEARFFTVEEYFEYEASIEGRADYRDGRILDRTAQSKLHGQIQANLCAVLNLGLRGKPHTVYDSSVKIQAAKANSFLYPDLSVASDEPDEPWLSDKIQTPIVIAEVLSESTAIDDFGAKFFAYQQIPSLTTYLLVDQYSPFVNVIYRNERGDWMIKSCSGLESIIEIRSVGIKIAMKDIYDKVVFPANKRQLQNLDN